MPDQTATQKFDDKLPSMSGEESEERHEDAIRVNRDEEAVSNDIEKVQSTSRRSDIDPFTEPPDGGLHAWLKVFGCFLLYSNIW